MKMKDAVLLWHDSKDIFKVCSHKDMFYGKDDSSLIFSHGSVFYNWDEWIKNKEYFPMLLLDILYGCPWLTVKTVIDELEKNVEDINEYLPHPNKTEKLPF